MKRILTVGLSAQKNKKLGFAALLLLMSCSSGNFPKNQSVNVVAEQTSWDLKLLSGEREKTVVTFDISTVTISDNQFQHCDKSSKTIERGRFDYEANKEYCSEYNIREWDGNRFLARTSDVAFSLVCETDSKKIDCTTVPDAAPREMLENPNKYPELISEKLVYTIR